MFFGYTQFHSVFLAVAVFEFIKNINWDKVIKKGSNIIAKISGCSFGIYLIHQIVMYYETKISDVNTTSIIWRIGGAFLTYFVSLVIIYLLKKIPIVRKVVP